jgi:DNA-binding transcriptional regulator YhcF (GntR family)
MSLIFGNIDFNTHTPIFEQIVDQAKYQVASGRLAPGVELPPIRVLAEQLPVNPNIVARPYRELELAGVVTKRRTAGTYVSGAGSPLARRERVRILTERGCAPRRGPPDEYPHGGDCGTPPPARGCDERTTKGKMSLREACRGMLALACTCTSRDTDHANQRFASG